MLLSIPRKISEKEPFDSFQREDCINLKYAIHATMRVFGSHVLNEMCVPHWVRLSLRIVENPIYIADQLLSEPFPIMQELMLCQTAWRSRHKAIENRKPARQSFV